MLVPTESELVETIGRTRRILTRAGEESKDGVQGVVSSWIQVERRVECECWFISSISHLPLWQENGRGYYSYSTKESARDEWPSRVVVGLVLALYSPDVLYSSLGFSERLL